MGRDDVDEPMNEQGLTELHLGAYHQDVEWVGKCLEAGIDVNKTDSNGRTPLVWAIDMAATGPAGAAVGIVDVLLEHGADVGINPTGFSSLLDFAQDIHPTIHAHLASKPELWTK